MSDSPRRVRARGWAWACLGLFGDPDGADSAATGPDDDAPDDSG
ncbi:hypothetical protein [Halorubrum ezzemoulense]|nr:hypothetical protein [Halorubrum ezzemoulense]